MFRLISELRKLFLIVNDEDGMALSRNPGLLRLLAGSNAVLQKMSIPTAALTPDLDGAIVLFTS